MEKKTAEFLERAALELIGGAVGAVCEHVVAPFLMGVIKYDFLWKHPNASRDAVNTRLRQEGEIIMEKVTSGDRVLVSELNGRGRPYSYRYRYPFAGQLEDLLDRMIENGATKEECESIATMYNKFRFGPRGDSISINNLRWIHKMEDKYGVEEKFWEGA